LKGIQFPKYDGAADRKEMDEVFAKLVADTEEARPHSYGTPHPMT